MYNIERIELFYDSYFAAEIAGNSIADAISCWSIPQQQYFVSVVLEKTDDLFCYKQYLQGFRDNCHYWNEIMGKCLEQTICSLFKYAQMAGFTKKMFLDFADVYKKYSVKVRLKTYFKLVSRFVHKESNDVPDLPLLPELNKIVNKYLEFDYQSVVTRMASDQERRGVDFIFNQVHAKETYLQLKELGIEGDDPELIGRLEISRISTRIYKYVMYCYPLFEEEIIDSFLRQIKYFQKLEIDLGQLRNYVYYYFQDSPLKNQARLILNRIIGELK